MIAFITNNLLAFLQEVDDNDYSRMDGMLSGSSIGQHIRHSIEMYQCLMGGYHTAKINYSNRKRDVLLETSSMYAVQCLREIASNMPIDDKAILVEEGGEKIMSSFKREQLYCNEHLIHHLALIKMTALQMGYTLPETFGVAPSTIKYKQQCAQ